MSVSLDTSSSPVSKVEYRSDTLLQSEGNVYNVHTKSSHIFTVFRFVTCDKLLKFKQLNF